MGTKSFQGSDHSGIAAGLLQVPSARSFLQLQRKHICSRGESFADRYLEQNTPRKGPDSSRVAGHIVAGTATDTEEKQLNLLVAELEK